MLCPNSRRNLGLKPHLLQGGKRLRVLKVTIKKGEEQCPGKIRSMSDGKTLESMICHSRFLAIQQQVQS